MSFSLNKTVLVTGGAGYIGSHMVIKLIEAGYQPIVVDNFANSSPKSIERVSKITGKKIIRYEADLRDVGEIETIFNNHTIDSVIHFAGLKAVGESNKQPLEYYDNNLISTIKLLQIMKKHAVSKLVFSSSATVYNPKNISPLTEDSSLGPINPYGQTKLMAETILSDLAACDDWKICSLRYFNPIGAHQSGLIGESPHGLPNNLLPYVSQVAAGKHSMVSVFGDTYDTADGTGVRDYIHVEDLTAGHLAALQRIENLSGFNTYNLGTGIGTSVLELIQIFRNISGKEIPYKITDRRPGDISTVIADPGKASRELGWHSFKSVEDACTDSWRWQSQNPNGFED
ncbi:UDP-glucose 4-epimerase GalE [Candidatus Saccharibacteria bacterium]|nr:UDP-glucose 4-epimerase GalE [Candidatus Saccharibacteria bacterium]